MYGHRGARISVHIHIHTPIHISASAQQTAHTNAQTHEENVFDAPTPPHFADTFHPFGGFEMCVCVRVHVCMDFL